MSPLNQQLDNSIFPEFRPDDGFTVRMVSHLERSHIPGMDHLKQQFKFQGFTVEHFEYKVMVRKEIKRAINPKDKKSNIQEKVIIDEKVDLNSDLRYAKQLINRVNLGPENILLIHLNKARGEYFAIPLYFSRLQRDNKPILVVGMSEDVKTQLMCAPDLNFKEIPKTLQQNKPLLETMKLRLGRKKGIQASLRELMDLPLFPTKIRNKIQQISAGGNNELTEEEGVNLMLLSDMYSRYSAVLNHFETEMELRRLKVQQLSSMFCELMNGIPLKTLVMRLAPFLDDKPMDFKTLPQYFSYVYQAYLNLDDTKNPVYGRKGIKNKADFFKALRCMFLFSRSQQDPQLWKNCYYYCGDVKKQGVPEENLTALYQVTKEIKKQIKNHRSATHNSLVEIYSLHNFTNFLRNRKVILPKKGFTPVQFGLLRHMILPGFGIKVTKNDGVSFSLKTSDGKLIHNNSFSPHMLSRVYGVYIAQKLEAETRAFLKPGPAMLNQKFGNNLFDVLYEQVVLKYNLPISANQYAAWLQHNKMIGSLKEKGWIERKREADQELHISAKILNGSGDTLLPKKFDSDDYRETFLKYETDVNVLVGKIRENARKQGENNFYQILVDVFNKGIFHIRSGAFRTNIKNSFLHQAFQHILQEIAQTMMFDLNSAIEGSKVILKVPQNIEPLLIIGHTFQLVDKQTNQPIGIHLVASPVETPDQLAGLSKKFSSLLVNRLRLVETAQEKKLIEAANFFMEFHEAMRKYFDYLTLSTIDLLMRQLVIRTMQQSRMLPKHIKFYIPDDAKWLVGDLASRNLSKLLRGPYREEGKNKATIIDPGKFSFGQIIEGIEAVQRAEKQAAEAVSSIQLILEGVQKAPEEVRETPAVRQLLLGMNFMQEVLKAPLERIGTREAASFIDKSAKFKKIFKGFSPSNPRGVLFYLRKHISVFAEDWESHVYFYKQFTDKTHDAESGELTKLLLKAGAFMKQVRETQCVIFFLESDKEFQLRNLIKVDKGLKRLNPGMELFLETTSLQKSQVEFICRAFHPQHLFRVENLLVSELPQERMLQ